METAIHIFKMTDRKTIESEPIDHREISKVFSIVDPRSIKDGLGFPLPDIFGAVNGNMDVAICARAIDGKRIQVAVPTGQRHLTHTI